MSKLKYYVATGLVILAVIVGAYFRTRRDSGTTSSISAIGGTNHSVQINDIPYYLQNDPQWASETIGGSQERMASAGCTLACVAMNLSRLGHSIDPMQLCKSLKEKNGFTENGFLIWDRIEEITDGSITVKFPGLSHQTIESELQQGNPVIAKILLGESIPHWVLIVGKEGEEYLIMDPLNGKKSLLKLSERSRNINSIRVLHRAELLN